MAPMLAYPIITQFLILVIQEPFHNSYTNFTHNPLYTSFHSLHHNVENCRACVFKDKSVYPSSWSGEFLGPDYGFLRLKSIVRGGSVIIIHNSYRRQGSSSFISSLSQDSSFYDFYSAITNTSDVILLLHNMPLDTSA